MVVGESVKHGITSGNVHVMMFVEVTIATLKFSGTLLFEGCNHVRTCPRVGPSVYNMNPHDLSWFNMHENTVKLMTTLVVVTTILQQ